MRFVLIHYMTDHQIIANKQGKDGSSKLYQIIRAMMIDDGVGEKWIVHIGAECSVKKGEFEKWLKILPWYDVVGA